MNGLLMCELFVSLLTYSLVADIAINPEPRYGILPSLFILVCAIVVMIDIQKYKKCLRQEIYFFGFFFDFLDLDS